MYLESLNLQGLRNLVAATLHFSPQFNLFWGNNGSGKTSLLEAVHLLATGRSFRSTSVVDYISFDQSLCSLFAKSKMLLPRAEDEACGSNNLGYTKYIYHTEDAGTSNIGTSNSSGSENADTHTNTSTTTNINSDSDSNTSNNYFNLITSTKAFQLGLERHKTEGTTIRINQQRCATLAELARMLPLQLINTHTYSLLEGTSRFRRQFLDWGMFHVKHSFFPSWQRYAKALKQRNAALKRVKQNGVASVVAWDNELVGQGQILDEHRQEFISSFKPLLTKLLTDFLGGDSNSGGTESGSARSAIQNNSIDEGEDNNHKPSSALLTPALPAMEFSLRYKRGWKESLPLAEALESSLELDVMRGYTSQGPQRADLQFLINGNEAEAVLSRGQQKLLICALFIARAEWFYQYTKHHGIFLLDDLTSELDKHSSQWLLRRLKEMGGQVLLTAIEPDWVINFMNEMKDDETGFKMFHVKHGRISC